MPSVHIKDEFFAQFVMLTGEGKDAFNRFVNAAVDNALENWNLKKGEE